MVGNYVFTSVRIDSLNASTTEMINVHQLQPLTQPTIPPTIDIHLLPLTQPTITPTIDIHLQPLTQPTITSTIDIHLQPLTHPSIDIHLQEIRVKNPLHEFLTNKDYTYSSVAKYQTKIKY